VRIEGKIIRDPSTTVDPKNSRVELNGRHVGPFEPKQTQLGEKFVPSPPIRVWKYYKPPGFVCSRADEKNRETIYDILPKMIPRVVSVGRLDLSSEGIILLTTSGIIARTLELPQNQV
jgi:23S rRNA pseudouridine2605 synthase